MALQNYYDSENDVLKEEGTGRHDEFEDYKIVPFGRYLITLKLTPENKFIDVVAIEINKEFISYKQKTALKGYHDVEEFYKE
jgi:hypothetical protein